MNTSLTEDEMYRRTVLLYAWRADHDDQPFVPSHVLDYPHYQQAVQHCLAAGWIVQLEHGYRITRKGRAHWRTVVDEHNRRTSISQGGISQIIMRDYDEQGDKIAS